MAGRGDTHIEDDRFDALAAEELSKQHAWAEPCQRCRERVRTLEQRIGYTFRHVPLLFKALTHSSYAHENAEHGLRHNERLEFLGDAVLGLVLSEHLFRVFYMRWEGELSLMKAWLVSEHNLAAIAQHINLGYYLFLGIGEETSGGRTRVALLADALEALIGAVYLDGGLPAARALIQRLFAEKLATVDIDKAQINYKNALQRTMHPRAHCELRYVVAATSGPEHQRQYTVEVRVDSHVLGRGTGSSKKEAEMNAARDALERLASEEVVLVQAVSQTSSPELGAKT
ncbi:MAG: ribonuclease III [bacterium]|nr:ribonuclease III [bacterium]